LTIPEAAAGYFMRRLDELRERHPELLIVILSDNRALDLRRGEADVAVRLRGVTDPDLVIRRAGTAGWSLYASAEYIARKGPMASATDFRGHDVLAFESSLSEIEGSQWLRAHGADAKIVLRGNSVAAVASAALAGLGLAPLPCFVAEDCGLVRLRPELIGAREIIIAVHPDLTRVARVRAVMDYLVELFERDAALWSGVG
jgi:DNA-binding transcriptional LysR family regulator